MESDDSTLSVLFQLDDWPGICLAKLMKLARNICLDSEWLGLDTNHVNAPNFTASEIIVTGEYFVERGVYFQISARRIS